MSELTVPTKDQLLEAIEQLPPEQLRQVWEYMNQLTDQPTAPLYQIHEKAVSTGVKDLAQQHDHYLYGRDKSDA